MKEEGAGVHEPFRHRTGQVGVLQHREHEPAEAGPPGYSRTPQHAREPGGQGQGTVSAGEASQQGLHGRAHRALPGWVGGPGDVKAVEAGPHFWVVLLQKGGDGGGFLFQPSTQSGFHRVQRASLERGRSQETSRFQGQGPGPRRGPLGVRIGRGEEGGVGGYPGRGGQAGVPFAFGPHGRERANQAGRGPDGPTGDAGFPGSHQTRGGVYPETAHEFRKPSIPLGVLRAYNAQVHEELRAQGLQQVSRCLHHRLQLAAPMGEPIQGHAQRLDLEAGLLQQVAQLHARIPNFPQARGGFLRVWEVGEQSHGTNH